MNNSNRYDVIIIGGGLSGLAAAVKLSLSGARIALFEQSPILGGRCYSFTDEKTGDIIDNGQHLLVGAYHDLFEYLELIGTKDLVRAEPLLVLHLHHPEKGFGTFGMSGLPRPFHLLGGILKFKLLSAHDRRRLANVWWDLLQWNKSLEDRLRYQTVEQWLVSLGQSDEARRCLWDPLSVSVMNENPARASALLFARSLRATIFGKKSDAALVIPRTGQTELYVNGALKLFAERNTRVETNTEVKSISVDGDAVNGVQLRDGTFVPSGSVISTVQFYNINSIIPQAFQQIRPFQQIDKFSTSPIISVYLWFNKEFMEMEHLGLIGRDTQWIFNRRRLLDEMNKSTSCLCAVISSAYRFVDLPKEELVGIVLKDIHAVFPGSSMATVLHTRVLKEKRATFSPITDVEHYRPSCKTPIQNFYLAGDWTDTGYPATIEGAVISGFHAAACVMHS
jgi:squalene-associated FAD-dependent desaturase